MLNEKMSSEIREYLGKTKSRDIPEVLEKFAKEILVAINDERDLEDAVEIIAVQVDETKLYTVKEILFMIKGCNMVFRALNKADGIQDYDFEIDIFLEEEKVEEETEDWKFDDSCDNDCGNCSGCNDKIQDIFIAISNLSTEERAALKAFL